MMFFLLYKKAAAHFASRLAFPYWVGSSTQLFGAGAKGLPVL